MEVGNEVGVEVGREQVCRLLQRWVPVAGGHCFEHVPVHAGSRPAHLAPGGLLVQIPPAPGGSSRVHGEERLRVPRWSWGRSREQRWSGGRVWKL